MARTRITNKSDGEFGLPLPYRGVLSPGGYAMVGDDVPTTITNLGGASAIGPTILIEAAASTEALTLHDSSFAPATGSAMGLESAAEFVKLAALSTDPGIYGDGSDGVGTFDGAATPTGTTKNSATKYTLNRDVYYTTAAISPLVFVFENGFRLFCKTSLSIAATGGIQANGLDGAAGAAGAASPTGSLKAGAAGGAGGTAGGAGAAGGAVTVSAGGAAGAGGAATAGGAGGVAGAVTAPTAASGGIHTVGVGLTGHVSGNGAISALTGGSGGGGGGADGANVGGGGGSGAGLCLVAAPAIANNGVITANGGAGAAGTAGNAGGGGGGGGGLVAVTTRALTGTGTITAAGGALGAAAGTGTAGAVGAVGTVLQFAA